MKIAVVGLWHLGMVTAAALAAEGHEIVAFDTAPVIAAIESGELPVGEPGLSELVAEQRLVGRLQFKVDPQDARDAEIIWICYDTPVDDSDRADPSTVITKTRTFLAGLKQSAVVVISSQLPAGSMSDLSASASKQFSYACIPENLRLGEAIAYFRRPDRFVVGADSDECRLIIKRALHFAPSVVWTSVASAEVIKHAINAYLATSVVFANEIASICERVGADAREVEFGMKSDARIGQKAYVRAGEAFAGGTLMRDLGYLSALAMRDELELPQLRATAQSNAIHRGWIFTQISDALGSLSNRRLALLGLVYKPYTNTLRASNAVALARKLVAAGAVVSAYDPAILPGDPRLPSYLTVAATAVEALDGADAAIIATSWPVFREIDSTTFLDLKERLVIDQSRFLETLVAPLNGMRYVALGRPRAKHVSST